tara:strand:+ start:1214 stop:1390 length:177 start_codon:yes stop_codon:yes gene_type:complete
MSCSYSANEKLEGELQEAIAESTDAITETNFKYINTSEAVVSENFTDKKTIIIFWADY